MHANKTNNTFYRETKYKQFDKQHSCYTVDNGIPEVLKFRNLACGSRLATIRFEEKPGLKECVKIVKLKLQTHTEVNCFFN